MPIAIAVLVAAVATLILSSLYYALAPSLPTSQGASRPSRPKPWQVLTELLRSALVAGLVAGLMTAAGWGGPGAGVLLGLCLTIIPIVLLSGSVIWDGVPVRIAALHTGDWLIKLPVIGLIVGLFL